MYRFSRFAEIHKFKLGHYRLLPSLEIALVLVRLDQVASRIVNANHGIATESVSSSAPMKS
jgi:hypothetical protein